MVGVERSIHRGIAEGGEERLLVGKALDEPVCADVSLHGFRDQALGPGAGEVEHGVRSGRIVLRIDGLICPDFAHDVGAADAHFRLLGRGRAAALCGGLRSGIRGGIRGSIRGSFDCSIFQPAEEFDVLRVAAGVVGGDGIQAESVHAFCQPEGEDLPDLFAHGAVVQVQVRHAFPEAGLIVP